MALLRREDNRVSEFIKGLFGLLGIRVAIILFLFSLGAFSFNALIIPSIMNLFSTFPKAQSLNLRDYLLPSIEGSLLGLLFGLILNIIYCWKYPRIGIKTNIITVLILSVLIGFIVSFINGASGLCSIFEIINSKNITIHENTPVGQILSDWGLYNNSYGDKNSPTWIEFTILLILIIFMNIVISVFLGIIVGLVFAFFTSKFEPDDIPKKEIIFTAIISYGKKGIFVGGLIGLVYGIIGSILMVTGGT
jgi:hypothetical protein